MPAKGRCGAPFSLSSLTIHAARRMVAVQLQLNSPASPRLQRCGWLARGLALLPGLGRDSPCLCILLSE
jgi:hypothetical protein